MKTCNCHFCPVCDGYGCIGEMPGMGGPFLSRNFIANCSDWNAFAKSLEASPERMAEAAEKAESVKIRLAPMTGAVENVGYEEEEPFYYDLISACHNAGVLLGIGDGVPDCKLSYGICAVKKVNSKAAVFIKPYPDEKIFERIEWASPVAEYCGIDIDSSNIATMRNLVHLEKKTPVQLLSVKRALNAKGIPFAVKGIFLEQDVEMVKEVKPDVVFVSNHGGRVETREGSTAAFLKEYASTLKANSSELWVDGGIRTRSHVCAAAELGATTVLVGRPFASALCHSGQKGVEELFATLTGA